MKKKKSLFIRAGAETVIVLAAVQTGGLSGILLLWGRFWTKHCSDQVMLSPYVCSI